MTEGAASAIVMPKLGLSMTEGLVAEWLVAPGDEVAAGQVLFVVETDKISNEIEAPAAGRIVSLLVGAGDTVDVGAPVATWTGPGTVGAPPSLVPDESAAPARPEMVAPDAVPSNGVRIRSTPFARRLAKLDGIEIAQVAGTGARGRIQARDVQA
ncbi:MAG: dehydrogenase, partial [Sphingomonas bacterium]|nr:dehydrogenase [Sphingomonas bacterium]